MGLVILLLWLIFFPFWNGNVYLGSKKLVFDFIGSQLEGAYVESQVRLWTLDI